MKLFLQRREDNIGQLSIDGNLQCLIIENPLKKIPAGVYPIALIYSPRFQRVNPHIMDVPGREAIEIHTGTYYADSEGCLITGTDEMPAATNTIFPGEPFVQGSRTAYRALMAKIRDYIFADAMAQYDSMTIEIKNA
jgi:hypothetical protein